MAYYLADRSLDLKTSTLKRRLATIAEAHKAANLESPTKNAQVRYVWAGICREKGMAQGHAKPISNVLAVPLWTTGEALGPQGESTVGAILRPLTTRSRIKQRNDPPPWLFR